MEGGAGWALTSHGGLCSYQLHGILRKKNKTNTLTGQGAPHTPGAGGASAGLALALAREAWVTKEAKATVTLAEWTPAEAFSVLPITSTSHQQTPDFYSLSSPWIVTCLGLMAPPKPMSPLR